MNAMVTARVPVELKNQVSARLQSAGLSVTDLVRDAFLFYLNEGEMPTKNMRPNNVVRKVTPSVLEQVRKEVQAASIGVSITDDDEDAFDYKELIARGRLADYEALG